MDQGRALSCTFIFGSTVEFAMSTLVGVFVGTLWGIWDRINGHFLGHLRAHYRESSLVTDSNGKHVAGSKTTALTVKFATAIPTPSRFAKLIFFC